MHKILLNSWQLVVQIAIPSVSVYTGVQDDRSSALSLPSPLHRSRSIGAACRQSGASKMRPSGNLCLHIALVPSDCVVAMAKGTLEPKMEDLEVTYNQKVVSLEGSEVSVTLGVSSDCSVFEVSVALG